MDKKIAVHVVEEIAESRALSRDELLAIYDSYSNEDTAHPSPPAESSPTAEVHPEVAASLASRHVSINEVMYYIGATIVILGIVLLIGQNWESLSLAGRLLVTIGLGIVMFMSGTYLIRQEKTMAVGSAFHIVAAFALTSGMAVLIDGANRSAYADDSIAVQSGVMLLIYGTTFYLMRNIVFALLSIVFGSAFFWYGAATLFRETSNEGEFIALRFMLLGAAYVLLAYVLTNSRFSRLSRTLYGFGSLFVLTGTLIFTEIAGSGQFIWELLVYPLLLVGGFYLSTIVRSGAMLVWSTIFLMVYILILSGKYFAESIGWPIALMFAGLALIGSGYMAVTLKKRYIPKS